MTRVLLLVAHPDAGSPHLCHALAAACAEGAQAAGHEVRTLDVGQLEFPLLRSQHEWEHGALPDALVQPQQDIAWAQHLVLFFPLWLGDMPALLKAFLEQVARPGFAFHPEPGGNPLRAKGLAGRSAHIVVTMGMPAFVYRWYFRAHGLRSLKRNVLGFVGFSPVRETIIGSVGQLTPARAGKWLARMRRLGRAAR